MPKIIIELSESFADKKLIRGMFSELEQQYLTGVVQGSFGLTDTLKVNWKYVG